MVCITTSIVYSAHMLPEDHLDLVKAEISSPIRAIMWEHRGIAAVNLKSKCQLYCRRLLPIKLMSGTGKGNLWVILPLHTWSFQQHWHMSGHSHLVCVKLKARWIGGWAYESLRPAYHVSPPNTVHIHPQSQYLLNCHIFMRPMNITGVTNYNLSVVQESIGVFPFMAYHSCMLYQNIALSKQFKLY